MMRKIMSIMLLTIALAGIGCRLYWLNARYPGPEEQTYGLGESVRLGSYTVTFSGWSWSDGEILHELCPGFRLLPDENGQEYPISRERIGLAALTIEKTGTDDGTLDLTSMAFESGAWGNQFDMELMYLLNPQLGTLRLQMEEGESMEILLPMTMTDQQVIREQWKRIDDRTFYVVLDHYPQKTRFSCGGGIG